MRATLGSLFDGSGGFPLAGDLCGIVPVWASEVEPYPIAVTRSRFPQMLHLGDICKIDGAAIPAVYIITFGSPCQDMSIAGKRAGIRHESKGDEETTRSGLFMEAVRVIKEMREATDGRYPRFVVWENVPGAFSSNGGEDFRLVLEEIIKIVEPTCKVPPPDKNGWPYADVYMGAGWSLAYRLFDAQYWGVPQRRRRIYLVADLGGSSAADVLFEREGLRGYPAQGGTQGQGPAGAYEARAATADREGTDALVPYTLKIRSGCEGGGKGALIQEDKSATLSTLQDQCLFQSVVYDARDNGDGTTIGTLTGDHERTVSNCCPIICMDMSATVISDNASPALLSRDFRGPKMVAYPDGCCYVARRLTPTECARLQGFPDDWGHPDSKDDLTAEEYQFWLEVRRANAALKGQAVREWSKDQILRWYSKLHTPSAEHKLWGNGIALPTALYVMQGIADAMEVGTYGRDQVRDQSGSEDEKEPRDDRREWAPLSALWQVRETVGPSGQGTR